MAKSEIVLHVKQHTTSYGTTYVYTEVRQVREDESYPARVHWSDWPRDNCPLADLRMTAYGNPQDGIVMDGIYYDPCRVDLARAEAMAKVLRKLAKLQAEDQSIEAGDVFMQLAKLVGAKRAVWRPDSVDCNSMWDSEGEWCFGSIPDGRDRVRRLLALAIAKPEPVAA